MSDELRRGTLEDEVTVERNMVEYRLVIVSVQ